MTQKREVMNIEQTSEFLGISTDTLYSYASSGAMPAFKLGNRWRFRRGALIEKIRELEAKEAAKRRGETTG